MEIDGRSFYAGRTLVHIPICSWKMKIDWFENLKALYSFISWQKQDETVLSKAGYIVSNSLLQFLCNCFQPQSLCSF